MASDPAGSAPDAADAPPKAKPASDASTSSPPAVRADAEPVSLLGFLRERYLTTDRRLLGVFRITFGLLLLIDVLRRIPDATFFYSNEGVLSNHYSLFAPLARPYFSLFTALSTPAEVKIGMALVALVYGFYIAGYRTKAFQILAFVLYTSLNARNIFLENGGCVVISLLTAWTMFLPLGDRFSVDAVLRSLRARRDFTAASLNDRELMRPPPSPHVTLVALAIPLQIVAIYFFNTVHKTGGTWKDGSAVHWVLWQNRIATTWAGWFRMHEPSWFSPFSVKMTLVIEGAASVLVLSPVAQKYARTLHFVLTTILHLGIAFLLTLGPFSYVMVVLNMLVLPHDLFDEAARRLEKGRAKRTVVYDATDAGIHLVARVLARLDTFEKLTFVDSADAEKLPAGAPKATFACWNAQTRRWSSGTAAIIDACRSLPAGPVWAALFGNPLGQALLRGMLRRRDHLVASFGIHPGRPFDKPGLPFDPQHEPTPFGEQVRATLLALRESCVFILLVAFALEVSQDNWKVPPALKMQQARFLQPIIQYPRLSQGWAMFAPEAPKSDGTIVVDGVTADGRHLDPFTGHEPDFQAPLHGPWYQSQFFCDYFLKISFEGNRGYRDELKKYLFNWQRLEGKPMQDRLVSFDVYWVSNDSPPPGQTEVTNIQRKLLLTSK